MARLWGPQIACIIGVAFAIFCLGCVSGEKPVASIDLISPSSGVKGDISPVDVNTIAYWSFDGDSDDQAFDRGGESFDGVVYGGPGKVAGYHQNGFNLDGSNDYIKIGDHSQLDLTSEFTIEVWIKPHSLTDTSGYDRIITKSDSEGSSSNGWRLQGYKDTGRISFGAYISNTAEILPSNTILDSNSWYHIAVTWDRSSLKIYINGELEGSESTGSSMSTTNRPVYIGAIERTNGEMNTNSLFDGIIDELRITNNVLQTSEFLIGNISTQFRLKGSGSDSDGTIEEHQWNSSMNGNLCNTGNCSIDSNDLLKGTHNITLRVRDNDGDWSDNATFQLEIKTSNDNIIIGDRDNQADDSSPSLKEVIFILIPLIILILIIIGLVKSGRRDTLAYQNRYPAPPPPNFSTQRTPQTIQQAQPPPETYQRKANIEQPIPIFSKVTSENKEVTIIREFELLRGNIRMKIGIVNKLETSITDAALNLVFDRASFRLDHVEPELEIYGNELLLGTVKPGQKKSFAIYLDPLICSSSNISGILQYHDAHGVLQTLKMRPKSIDVVCPIFFTQENANTAMLRNLIRNQLEFQDSKLYEVPSGILPGKAFQIARSIMAGRDIQFVRKYITKSPYRAEAWYYGITKVKKHQLVMKISIIEETNSIEIFTAAPDVSALTGLLAELGSELSEKLRKHGRPINQITNITIKDSVLNRTSLLSLEGQKNINIKDSVISRSEIK